MAGNGNGNGRGKTLTDEQLAAVRRLYLDPEHDPRPQVIAKKIGASSRAVAAAIRPLMPERQAAVDKAQTTAVGAAGKRAQVHADRDAEMDARASAIARSEMDLRAKLVAKAHDALDEMTPVEALKCIRYVSPTKDTNFVERLAADRHTDKTTSEGVAELMCELRAEMLRTGEVEDLDGDGTATSGGDDPAVGPGGGQAAPSGPA